LDKTADVKILDNKLGEVKKTFDDHDKELKVVFSGDKEAEFKKNFEYLNNEKSRIKYNPRDCSELKDMYKKECRAAGAGGGARRADNMLNMFLAGGDLPKEDLEENQKEKEREEREREKDDRSIIVMKSTASHAKSTEESPMKMRNVAKDDDIIVTKKITKKNDENMADKPSDDIIVTKKIKRTNTTN